MIKIGLMGCGMVADYGHLPAIKQTKGLELIALFDPDPHRLQAARKKFAVPGGFTDPEQFFRSGIDVAVVTSPAPTHLENVRSAARHRKHVLCEKPIAMTEAESQEMIDIMNRAGLMLCTGFTYRFSPVSQQIKSLVAEGAVGEVRDLRLIYVWTCHGKYQLDEHGRPCENERRRGRMLEGGPMVDCGVHQIDLARWWLGSEVVAQSSAGVWVDEYEAPDHVYLHMDHASGAHTMVEMSYSYGHTAAQRPAQFQYDLIGTDGLIHYNREAKLFEVRAARGTRILKWEEEKGFEGMYRELARAIQAGRPGDMPTGADGLAATRIARLATEEALARRARPTTCALSNT